MSLTTSLAIVLAGLCLAMPAQAKAICTAISDAAGTHVPVQFGDCATRVTPASTFKVALALMGYDAGFLKDATLPELPFREGYADYGATPGGRRPNRPAG